MASTQYGIPGPPTHGGLHLRLGHGESILLPIAELLQLLELLQKAEIMRKSPYCNTSKISPMNTFNLEATVDYFSEEAIANVRMDELLNPQGDN